MMQEKQNIAKKTLAPNKLPERTVERLSEYRRTLLLLRGRGNDHIYSHELAKIHAITAVQVRRDFMLIGFTTISKKGYDVKELIDFIGNVLDSSEPCNVGIIGMGNLALAVTQYFTGKRSKLRIVAAFDNNPNKTGRKIGDIQCYNIDDFGDVARRHKIKVIILTLPAAAVNTVAGMIANTSVRGVLNFTSTPLNLSPEIFVEDYDMITLLEKVAYFSK